jgi:hypothetical protein
MKKMKKRSSLRSESRSNSVLNKLLNLQLSFLRYGGRWFPASHFVGFKLHTAWSLRSDLGHIGAREECLLDHVGGGI